MCCSYVSNAYHAHRRMTPDDSWTQAIRSSDVHDSMKIRKVAWLRTRWWGWISSEGIWSNDSWQLYCQLATPRFWLSQLIQPLFNRACWTFILTSYKPWVFWRLLSSSQRQTLLAIIWIIFPSPFGCFWCCGVWSAFCSTNSSVKNVLVVIVPSIQFQL